MENFKLISMQREELDNFDDKTKKQQIDEMTSYLKSIKEICMIGSSRKEMETMISDIKDNFVVSQLKMHYEDLLKLSSIRYDSMDKQTLIHIDNTISNLNKNIETANERTSIIYQAIKLILKMYNCEAADIQLQEKYKDYATFILNDIILCYSESELAAAHFISYDYVRRFRRKVIREFCNLRTYMKLSENKCISETNNQILIGNSE